MATCDGPSCLITGYVRTSAARHRHKCVLCITMQTVAGAANLQLGTIVVCDVWALFTKPCLVHNILERVWVSEAKFTVAVLDM